MKNKVLSWGILLILLILFAANNISARDTRYDYPDFEEGMSYIFGDGVHFQYKKNAYHLHLGGWIEPSFTQTISEGLTPPPIPFARNGQASRRNSDIYTIDNARVFLGAQAKKEKVSAYFEFDLSDPFPLVDAWIAIHAIPDRFFVSLGQKKTFSNNRTHYAPENKLQFEDRGPLSRYFSGDGREFGVFLEGIAPGAGKTVVKPGLAITNGDGRNSFGANFTEFNLGGIKFGARLDLLFLGEFGKQGDYYAVDLVREPKPKYVLGFAYSYNQGASDPRGDGRRVIQLYAPSVVIAGSLRYPDYEKIYFSSLLKVRGFSWLLEFVQSRVVTGTPLYTVPVTPAAATNDSLLTASNLGNYYAVGQALNMQFGYLWKNGSALSFAFANIKPSSLKGLSATSYLPQENWYTIGFSQYFTANYNAKFSFSYSIVDGRPFADSTDANQNDYSLFNIAMLVNF